MKIPEGWPTDVMIEVGANVIAAAGRCTTWEEASAAAKHIYKAMNEHAPTPPAQSRHELDDADIRAIALDCGFKLKPQPDGTEDLNPYVYLFTREILSTLPRAEDVEAMHQRLTPPAQDNNKAIADYNEPAMESSWQYLKTQLDSKGWTTGEAFTYRGFFAWGWEARRQHHAPPAQENQWQEAVLNECMTIEGCYTESDPVGTVKCLIDWHVRNTANWTKGATPPAPEVEPVAWKEAVRLAYGYLWHVNELHEVPIPIYSPSRAAYEARKQLRELLTNDERGRGINDTRETVYGSREVPLLHNDGLRKASERADTSLEILLYRVAEGIDHLPLTESIRAIRKTLRDALKEK